MATPGSFWAEQGTVLSLVANEAAIVPTSGNFFLSPAWPGSLGDASRLQLDALTAPSTGGSWNIPLQQLTQLMTYLVTCSPEDLTPGEPVFE